MKAKMDDLMAPELQQHAISGVDEEIENALENGGAKIPPNGLVSVKSSRNKMEKHQKKKENHMKNGKRSKDSRGYKPNKKRKS